MLNNSPVVLITGAARRIGAVVAAQLHGAGMNVIIHYHRSASEAQALADQLNHLRTDSAIALQADLLNESDLAMLVERAATQWNRLDALVNNASSFYPTPFGQINDEGWTDLMGSNLKAPIWLTQAAAPLLKAQHGCIVNMIDVHAERPLKNHPVYCAAKAGLASFTKSAAKDLGPEIRVNGVAPGSILWPEQSSGTTTQADILERTALKRSGTAEDIAKTIQFLILDAPYITGQIIAVDGGRSLSQ